MSDKPDTAPADDPLHRKPTIVWVDAEPAAPTVAPPAIPLKRITVVKKYVPYFSLDDAKRYERFP